MEKPDDLRGKLLALQGPGLARAVPPSLRERCESTATRAFAVAIAESGLSQRAVARRLSIDERYLRDLLSGNRNAHVWMALALPREGRLAFIRELLADVPENAEDEEAISATG